ncbi:MAG: DUF4412 domain-containing protein [candidate division WOR-3 bacterium]
MKKFLLIYTITGILHGGWIIKFEEKAKDEKPETMKVYISKGMIVSEKKKEVFIFDFTKEIIRIIDHDEKSYFEGKLDEYISFYEKMERDVKGEIEERMKEIPPEYREIMEKMIKPEVNINIRKLDKKEKILGYNTEVYEIETETKGTMFSMKTRTESYISPDLKFVPSEIRKEDAERISKKFEKIKDEYGFSNMISKIEEGFVLKSILYNEEGKEIYRTQAISINKGEIPSSLIEIPKGYEKEELKDILMEK